MNQPQGSGAERRSFHRFSFEGTVRLYSGTAMWETKLVDISLKGALVKLPLDATFPEGIACRLDVSLDDVNDHIQMEGRIAHLNNNRIGVLCQTIDLDSVTHLRRLVELNLGDPELLSRELSALISD